MREQAYPLWPSAASFPLRHPSQHAREELIRQLGEPAERITVDETEFLFYYTDWINTSKAIERSPFAIEDGRVVSMGKTYYYAYLKAHGRFKGDA